MQSRARASEPTSIEDVLQEDLVMYHTSPKERVYCITIPFVLKASSHVELVQAAATCQLRLRDGARGRALSVSQSVSQLFHGPAPRSPLHRLAVRLRHSRRPALRRARGTAAHLSLSLAAGTARAPFGSPLVLIGGT